MTAANDLSCALCGQLRDLYFHHLIPRKMHRRNNFKKNYSREQLDAGIMICKLCHRGLHKTYDEMTLAKDFNTIEAIRQDDTMQRHILWSRKQKITFSGNQ